MDDFLDGLVCRVLAAACEGPAKVDQVVRETRMQWGGVRVYIRKDPTPAGKAGRIGAALASGMPLDQAFEDAGVSRATGFRLIRRRLVRSP